jgi:hypothetical protein
MAALCAALFPLSFTGERWMTLFDGGMLLAFHLSYAIWGVRAAGLRGFGEPDSVGRPSSLRSRRRRDAHRAASWPSSARATSTSPPAAPGPKSTYQAGPVQGGEEAVQHIPPHDRLLAEGHDPRERPQPGHLEERGVNRGASRGPTDPCDGEVRHQG